MSKLVHIGKATVDKLQDLRGAAQDEGFEMVIPDHLNRVEKVRRGGDQGFSGCLLADGLERARACAGLSR